MTVFREQGGQGVGNTCHLYVSPVIDCRPVHGVNHLSLRACWDRLQPPPATPAQVKCIQKMDRWRSACGLQPKPPLLLYAEERKHSMCSGKRQTKHLYTGVVSHRIHSWCSDIINTEPRKKRLKQTNSYLIAEMLISGFLFLRRYKWLISMGPLQNKQALCLCFVLPLCLSSL